MSHLVQVFFVVWFLTTDTKGDYPEMKWPLRPSFRLSVIACPKSANATLGWCLISLPETCKSHLSFIISWVISSRWLALSVTDFFLIFTSFYNLFFVCMSISNVHMSVCVCVTVCQRKPEEGTDFPSAGAKGGDEFMTRILGTKRVL